MLRYGAMLVFGVGCAQVADIGDVTSPPIYTGTVTASGTGQGLSGAQVQLHEDLGTSAPLVTTATTDEQGGFTIPLEDHPLPFYGYFEVHDDAITEIETINHFNFKTSDDVDQQITMFTPSSLAQFATDSGGTQAAGTWLVVATIFDADGNAVSGTTVTGTSGTVCYAKGEEVPVPHCGDASATQTDKSGMAWIFSAMETGTFEVMSASGAYTNFPLNANSVVYTPVKVGQS